MSQYRYYPPIDALLIGYDPSRDLDQNHLVRLVDQVVDEAVSHSKRVCGKGQPPYDPRLCLKVLVYAYSTGVRSSRQMERLCRESLPYLFLTRGDAPSYRTLCTTRVKCSSELDHIWVALFAVGVRVGLKRMGRLVLDSTKIKADASHDSVVNAKHYEAVRDELKRLLAESAVLDAEQDGDGNSGSNTVLDTTASSEQMRDIVRRVKSEIVQSDDSAPLKPRLSRKMRQRAEAAIETLEMAQDENLKHVSLTDPDSRMQPEGRDKKIKECHSFEVVMDNSLIVASDTTTTTDNCRLIPLVEIAKQNESVEVVSVDADSGYWRSDDILALEQIGIQTCIPNTSTACDLHRHNEIGTAHSKRFGAIEFAYDTANNYYVCPESNKLRFRQQNTWKGQTSRVYIAAKQCTGCALAAECLIHPKAKRRMLRVAVEKDKIRQILDRFKEPEHRERYNKRGPCVETVFGFLKAVLGYRSWSVRGSAKVKCEASLFKLAYQFRKLYAQGARA